MPPAPPRPDPSTGLRNIPVRAGSAAGAPARPAGGSGDPRRRQPGPSPRARLVRQVTAFVLLVVVVLGLWKFAAGGGSDDDQASAGTLAAGAAATTTSGATDVTEQTGSPATTTASAAPAATTPDTTPATTTPAATTADTTAGGELRTPTAADPLRLYIAGDSLAQGYGVFLKNLTDGTGVVDATLDVKASTGLTRPDFFDWPEHIAAGLAAQDPEVVVVTFGGNDGQPLRVDGTSYDVSAPEWQAEYARRVGAMMDQLAEDGRRVVWVGTPNAKSATFTARLEVMNEIYRQEAAKRPGTVAFVDAWALLSGPNGEYASSLPDASGKIVKMRAGDGFHLTVAGAKRLANAVLDEIEQVTPLPEPSTGG